MTNFLLVSPQIWRKHTAQRGTKIKLKFYLSVSNVISLHSCYFLLDLNHENAA